MVAASHPDAAAWTIAAPAHEIETVRHGMRGGLRVPPADAPHLVLAGLSPVRDALNAGNGQQRRLDDLLNGQQRMGQFAQLPT